MTPSDPSDLPPAPMAGGVNEPPPGPSSTLSGDFLEFFSGSSPEAEEARALLASRPEVLRDLEARFSPARIDDPTLPAEIGPYRILEKLGRGGMALVLRALNTETEARVALKVARIADTGLARALRTEAEGLARIRHQNVVRVLDHGATSTHAWVALELIEGTTLRQLLIRHHDAARHAASRRQALRRAAGRDWVRQVVAWFRDLARALHEIHRVGLVHRDIKPANILVAKDGRPFLIDFGLALEDGDATVRGGLTGTIPYMSPEQTLGGILALTAKSDIYSLAASFHEALTGRRTAPAEAAAAVIAAVAFRPVPPPSRTLPTLPHSLDPIFEKALAKDPDDRHSTAAALAEDLECWLAGRRPTHVRESPRQALRRILETRRPAVVAGLALVLIAALALAVPSAARRRALSREMDEVRALMASGDPLLALERLEAREALSGHSDFDALHREALLRSAPDVTHALISGLTFCLRTRLAGSPFDLAARRARFELRRTEDAHLVFHAALHDCLAGEPAQVLAFLDSHARTTARSALLLELRALSALESMADPGDPTRRPEALDRLVAAETAADDAPPGAVDPSDVASIRAYRLLRRAELTATGVPGDPSDFIEAAGREIARLATDVRASRSFRYTLEGLHACLRRDHALALHRFEAVVAGLADDRTRGPALDPAGILAFCARTAALAAAEDGAGREAFRDKARDYLRLVPDSLDWLARGIHGAAVGRPRIAADFCIGILGPAGASLPSFTPAAFELLAFAALAAYAGRDAASLAALADIAERRWRPDLTAPAARHWHDVIALRAWNVVRRIRDDRDPTDTTAALAAEARRLVPVVEVALGRGPGRLRFDLEFALAALASFLATAPDGRDDAASWRLRARTLLQSLLAPETESRELAWRRQESETRTLADLREEARGLLRDLAPTESR